MPREKNLAARKEPRKTEERAPQEGAVRAGSARSGGAMERFSLLAPRGGR